MGTEKPDNIEDALENQRKMSSVSYNVYDTITSTTSDTSNTYFVYDTISSTATGMTMLGAEGSTLNDSYLDLHQDDEKLPSPKREDFEKLGSMDKTCSNMTAAWLRGRKQGACKRMKKNARKKLPILDWLPLYNADSGVSDMIAGVTVGLTVIPQGIAYAVVAGLPPQYGLYSAFMGCFVYCLFGSAKDITIGPTAIMALMTNTYAQYGPQYAVLLSFLSGIIILLCGLLQLGFLIDFISVPVIAGFTSAAALTIASGQWSSLLGLTIDKDHKSHTHAGVTDYYIDIVHNIGTIRWQDAVLGLVCSLVLLSLRAINRTQWFKPIKGEPFSVIQRLTNRLPAKGLFVLDKIVWFICTARNAMVVIICLVLAWYLDPELHSCKTEPEECVFTLTGSIESGLPAFQPPPFSIPASNSSINGTSSDQESVSFTEMAGKLGSAIIIIPIIAILESVAIAKAFACGKPVDASQEMVALGLCNIVGSFVQAMPTTGSFSRTAVNSASGVKTSLGGVYTGGLVILCLAFLMPYCAFIPKATLAAVILTAVIFSVEHHVIKPMWNSKKIDLLPGFVCFLVGLFYELEMGIFSGIGVHLMIVMYHTARPGVMVEIKQVPGAHQHYLSIRPDQGIVFPSVSYIRNLISKAATKEGNSIMPVIIDCSHVSQTDFTAAEGFHAMLGDFKKRSQPVYWLATNQGVISTLKAIAGDDLKLLNGPLELASKRHESPRPQAGSVTEMVTISEESHIDSVALRKNTPKEIPKSFATFY